MLDIKSKKPSRRRKAGNSPIPAGQTHSSTGGPCGHSGCATTCQVRFVGPTSHPRDHQILTAARGVANAWTAAIVAGLAVVLTGAIAYTAVEAQSPKGSETNRGVAQELAKLNRRLNSVEELLRKHVSTDAENCPFEEPESKQQELKQEPRVPANPTSACVEKCTTVRQACLKDLSAAEEIARAACEDQMVTCQRACTANP